MRYPTGNEVFIPVAIPGASVSFSSWEEFEEWQKGINAAVVEAAWEAGVIPRVEGEQG